MKWKVIDPYKLPKVAAVYRIGHMVYGPGQLYTNGGNKPYLRMASGIHADPEVTHYLPVSELLQEVESE